MPYQLQPTPYHMPYLCYDQDVRYGDVFGSRPPGDGGCGVATRECYSDELADLRFKWVDWTWVVPGEPECSNDDYASWCDAFSNRSLLFVGDSTIEQQYISLLALLNAADHDPVRSDQLYRPCRKRCCGYEPCKPHEDKAIRTPPTREAVLLARDGRAFRDPRMHYGLPNHVCGGRGRVAFVRNDLVCHPGWGRDCHGQGGMEPFTQLKDDYETLVLSSGTHVLEPSVVQQHTRALAHWINTTMLEVIWRTAVPGHAGCGSAVQPLHEHYTPPGGGKWAVANQTTILPPNTTVDPRRWSLIELNNQVVIDTLDEMLPGRVAYLDAAAISNRRADRHSIFIPKKNHSSVAPEIDCLHYCLPGPPDDWNRVLRVLLLRGREKM